MIKLAANLSMLFTELELPARFAAAKQSGFDAVEIQFPYETPVADLLAAKQAAGVEVALINVPADDLMQGGEGLAAVPGQVGEFHRALDQCLEYAARLGVSCVNVLPGRCFNPDLEEVYLDTFKTNLVAAADQLDGIGVKCCFEAINTVDMPGFLISTVAQQQSLICELNHANLYAQFDIYHMQMMGLDVERALTQHIAEIAHIQFADAPGRGQPGSGDINFDPLLQALTEGGYDGYLAAEYKPQGATESTLAWMEDFKRQLSLS